MHLPVANAAQIRGRYTISGLRAEWRAKSSQRGVRCHVANRFNCKRIVHQKVKFLLLFSGCRILVTFTDPHAVFHIVLHFTNRENIHFPWLLLKCWIHYGFPIMEWMSTSWQVTVCCLLVLTKWTISLGPIANRSNIDVLVLTPATRRPFPHGTKATRSVCCAVKL